jgi:hypothetical protein
MKHYYNRAFCNIIGAILIFYGTKGAQLLSQDGDTMKTARPSKWRIWGEFYNESTSSQKTLDNMISFSHTRNGLRFTLASRLSLESYLLIRYGKDLNKDFWNNRFESGLGLRLRFSKKLFLAYYLEMIYGQYRNIPENLPQPGHKLYKDFRTGLIFWYGWDTYFDPGKWLTFPFIWWGEVYSDVSYFHREDRNIIGYGHVRTGYHLVRVLDSYIDLFGVIYVNRDANKDFWNNKVEFGSGLWIKPFNSLEMKVYMEWLSGRYMGIEGNDPNPYSQQYSDRRMGILFWIGW